MLLLLALLTALVSQSTLIAQEFDPAEVAARQRALGLAKAQLGRSGLRRFLGSSGVLGDLQNRAGSYRLASRLEFARRSELEARIRRVDEALAGDLPPEVRDDLERHRHETLTALAKTPTYDARYGSGTLQAESLVPAAFIGGRPAFLLVKARGHRRWDRGEGLDVGSVGIDFALVAVPSDDWMLAAGLSGAFTDVAIAPFSGESGSLGLGPRLDVGFVAGPHWAIGAHAAHRWTGEESTVVRAGEAGPVQVSTEGSSRVSTLKTELMGRYALGSPLGLSVRPLAGVYALRSRSESRENRGPPMRTVTEALFALRVGATLGGSLGADGRWSPALHLGYEYEVPDDLNRLVPDPHAFVGVLGVSYAFGRVRRLLAEYSVARGFAGLRRSSEASVILLLDL